MNIGTPRLVTAKIDDEVDQFTLASSIGYVGIQCMRNAVLVELVRAQALEKLPEWQRKTAAVQPKKRRKRDEIKELLEHRDVLKVFVPGVDGNPGMDIDMIAPVFDNEELRVKLDCDQINHMVDSGVCRPTCCTWRRARKASKPSHPQTGPAASV